MTAALRAPAALTRATAPILVALTLSLGLVSARPAEAAAPDTTRLTVGVEERVRTENWDDLSDFDSRVVDARHQLRLRTRAWARLGFGASEVAVGLLNESRRSSTPRVALQMDETVFETLYLDHRFGDGAAVRLGRQNIMRGDGFVLMDGSPGDGSRSAYVNAVDLAWTRGKSRLDVLLIADPYRDEFLPRIHDRRKSLIEWDEAAAGLYYSWPGPCGKASLDHYWLYKSETGDPRSAATRQPDRMFHTLGTRVARAFDERWAMRVEVAGQLGSQQPSTGIRAWGGQAALTRTFAHPTRPSLTLGLVGLSGDDPGTADRNEGWDPLFSRYPRWSELYIYTLPSERGVAYWTNLSILQLEARVSPARTVDVRASYQRLGAFHRFPGKASIYADGTARGDLFAARVDLKLNDSWRGHVVGERLAPGDFYVGEDPGWFFRAEVTCAFQRVFVLGKRTPEEQPTVSR